MPEGIKLADAATVLPAHRIVAYRNGSFALFSNCFRYELQRRGLGTWLDCDAYLLRPLDGNEPYLVGEYEPGRLNTAVLRMPRESPLLEQLLAPFDERVVPFWLPWRAKSAAYVRKLATGRTGIEYMPWGTTGPKGLTALVNRLQVRIDPLPPDVLYPVRWEDSGWIADPNQRLEDHITSRTVSLHLWNQCVKHLKAQPAPPGSFLARIQAEGERY